MLLHIFCCRRIFKSVLQYLIVFLFGFFVLALWSNMSAAVVHYETLTIRVIPLAAAERLSTVWVNLCTSSLVFPTVLSVLPAISSVAFEDAYVTAST